MQSGHRQRKESKRGSSHGRIAATPVIRGLIFLFVLLIVLYTAGCAQIREKEEPEIAGIIELKKSVDSFDYAASQWPADSRLICGSAPYPSASVLDCKIIKADENCCVRFANVSMQEFISWLAGFAGARWHLAETGAVKGARKLNIAYKDNILQLDFEKSGGEGDWPDELPLELCAAVPYFRFGSFEQLFARQIENCKQAYVCVYKQVDEGSVLKYENTLLENGFTYKLNSNQRRYFEKGRFFVAPNLKETNNSYSVLIGEYKQAAQAWPDGLSEELRNNLPAAGCACTVAKQGNAVRLAFNEMHLDDAACWFGALLNDGWEFSDSETMLNKETGLFMRIAEYAPGKNQLAVEISNVKSSPYRVTAFDDGLKDFDFILTKAKYSAKDAKKGVAAEFGPGASVADWKELAAKYGNHANVFLDACGIAKGDSVWLALNKKEFKGKKHYLMKRPNAKAGGTTLQRLKGNAAWLLLSDTAKQRVLAKVKVQ